MDREMCHMCPFRQGSPAFRFKEGWSAYLDENVAKGERTLPHGCNMLEDAIQTSDPKLVCVGHLNHMLEKGQLCPDAITETEVLTKV